MGASSDLSARGGNKRVRRILADALPEEIGHADLIERFDLIDLCLPPFIDLAISFAFENIPSLFVQLVPCAA